MTASRRGDGIADLRCLEPFGFFHADLGLPHGIAAWLGFFATVPVVGFYRHACGEVVALSERGLEVASNAPALAAILSRAFQRAPSVIGRLEAAHGSDSELCILVEPGISRGWYLGTANSLHHFFGIARAEQPRGFEPCQREDHVKFGSATFEVTPLERMTFLALMRYFIDRP